MEFKAKIKNVQQITPYNVIISLQTTQNGDFIEKLTSYIGQDKMVKINDLKRSINQNALLWKYIGLLSVELEATKEEIYKSYIQKYGKFVDYEMINEAIPTMVGSWQQHGTGWITEIVDKGEERSQVRFYYGSSCYGKKRFSKLINAVMDDCELLGIPVEREWENEKHN